MAGNVKLAVRLCRLFCILLVFVFDDQQAFATCPSLCTCGDTGGSIMKYVQCDKVNLTTLPSNIPADTDSLFLSSTKITSLTANYFSRIPNLKRIDLSKNQIDNITDGVFNGLPNLKTLNLLNCGIKRISSNAFAGLTSLTKLSLGSNQLTTIPNNLLQDLTNLQILNLGKNYLQSIPDGFLNSTAKLRQLDLSRNRITRIPDHAFLVPGSTLNFIFLDSNKLSTFPKALYDLTSKYIMDLRLNNNGMTTIPREAKLVFDRVTFGTIQLSGNPYACASSLQWLQSWAKGSRVLSDKNDVTCTTVNGGKAKLIEYDFNSTESPSVLPTTLVTITTTTTTTKTAPTTSTLETTDMSTTHASLTTTLAQQTSSSPRPQIDEFTTYRSSSTEAVPTTSERQTKTMDITIISDDVSSTQNIPGEVNTSVLDKKEHIILATCLSAAFIAIVVFIAMYCFRRKIIKRDKTVRTRYGRVRVV